MRHDDTIGHVLSRREILSLVGLAGAAALVPSGLRASAASSVPLQRGAPLPACVVRPEMTEGPYFVDQQLNRSDIRAEPATGAMREGVPLEIALSVSQTAAGMCRPLAGATVDIWQCDAKGVYSGVSDQSFQTVGQKFLRGVQTTDAGGMVRFMTIYPGWYEGRTIHVHFKIRTQAAGGGAYEFTSQWYFDEAQNDRILADPRYARPGRRETTNANDMLFRAGGSQLLLNAVDGRDGLSAPFGLALDLSDASVGRADGFSLDGRGGGRGRPGGPPPGARGRGRGL